MTVADLFNSMEKKEYWSFTVYVDSSVTRDNVLAYCNECYDVQGTKNKGDGFFSYPYSVADLFDKEVLSFYPSMSGISVKIDVWEGIKFKQRPKY